MTRNTGEANSEERPDRFDKREALKRILMQLRCFLGDEAYPVTDAEIDALPKDALKKQYDEAGRRLDELWYPYHDRQKQREHDGLKEGMEKYRAVKEKRLAKGWAAGDAVGRKLIGRFAKPLRDAIIDFRIRTHTGKAARNATAARFLDCFRPDAAAYITVRVALALCLQARHRGTGYVLWRDLTRELWTHLEDEYKMTKVFKRDTAGAVATLKEIADAEKALSRVTDRAERKKLSLKLQRYKKALAGDFPEGVLACPPKDRRDGWTPPYSQLDKQQAAQILLIRLVENSGGAFGYDTTVTESRGRKLRTPGIFYASKKLWEEFQAMHGRLEFLAPVERPMIYPPSHWNTANGEIDGGYRFDLKGRMKMVKTHDREALRRVDRVLLEPSPLLAGTLDALQHTPYRINRRVYEIMREVDDRGTWTRYKLPPCVAPKHTPDKKWKWSAWKREGERKMFVFKNVLDEARDNLAEPMIFFPYAYDFRGRIYASGGSLNPQGAKYALALLEFAEGRRMGDDPDAAKWLKIHGANCYGEDKESITARIAWTEKNSTAIENVARAPLDSNNRAWWTKADEPWLFLAFCFEWAGYQKRRADHVTHLPIHVDGKCNGTQHMAALMRCRDTGELVGLCGDDENKKPYDLYQAVADMADARIRRDARSGSAKDKVCAKRIIDAIDLNPKGDFRINRKLVKGAVMTYGYGATAHGMMEGIGDTIFEWLKPAVDNDQYSETVMLCDRQWVLLSPQESVEADDGEEKEYTFGKIKAYIQRVVLEAIEEKAKAAASVMNILKSLATALTQLPGEGRQTECRPIAWTSPAGFPIHFAKEKRVYKRLETYLYPDAVTRRNDEAAINERAGRKPKGGRKVTMQIVDGDKLHELDAAAMRAGFPPHVIHSLDAAHMMKTVAACRVKGILSFAMIHDSYATHATNMTTMNTEIRRAFVDMYRDLDMNTLAADIVAGTRRMEWEKSQLEAPYVELTNTLDIGDVLTAVYFFA